MYLSSHYFSFQEHTISHVHSPLYSHEIDTPSELAAYASEYYSHEYPEGHPARPPASKFRWVYHSHFPILSIGEHTGDVVYWEAWYTKEREYWLGRHPDVSSDDFEVWWLRQPELFPIVVVRSERGWWYTWDGSHRLATAYIHRRWRIPAVIGI